MGFVFWDFVFWDFVFWDCFSGFCFGYLFFSGLLFFFLGTQRAFEKLVGAFDGYFIGIYIVLGFYLFLSISKQ